MLGYVKRSIKGLMMSFGYQVKLIKTIDAPISLWDTDKQFADIYKDTAGHTIVDKARCFMLYQYARQVKSVAGQVAEIGVYKGGSAKLLAAIFESSGKTVYLFDTFSGMPPSDPSKDTYKAGDFGDTSLEEVTAFLSGCKNIRIHKGLFPLKPNPVENETFCMAHIDVDIHKSIMDCCNFFYSRMSRSGVMIFDDYGFPLCPGAKAAVDAFFTDKKERPIYLPTGQCVVTKL